MRPGGGEPSRKIPKHPITPNMGGDDGKGQHADVASGVRRHNRTLSSRPSASDRHLSSPYLDGSSSQGEMTVLKPSGNLSVNYQSRFYPNETVNGSSIASYENQ